MERVIEIQGLRKTYGDLEAVAGIDVFVDRGEVFALLGPNGAGKTTTTEILEGYRPRTAGEVTVLGHDPAKGEHALKQRIGIVLQSTGVDPFLTVRETVEMYGGYYPKPRPADRGDRGRRSVGEDRRARATVERWPATAPRRRDRAVGRPGAAVPR